MSISVDQKRSLNVILFITGVVSLFYYSNVIFLANRISWMGYEDLYVYANSDNWFWITISILPYLLLIIGYGVQFILIFLKPNKKRFIFSIVSYSLIAILFVVLISVYVVTAEIGIFCLSEAIGIVPWSFTHLLFLLTIMINLGLAIFLTHIKVRGEQREESLDGKKIIKTKIGITYLVIATVSFILIAFYITSVYQIMGVFLREKLRGYEFKNFIYAKNIDEILLSAVLAFQVMLMIGVTLQIVSIIDNEKRKQGLTGIILQAISVISSLLYFPYCFKSEFKEIKAEEISYIILYSLTIAVFISCMVMFFVFRKQNKLAETRNIRIEQ